jgi:DNA topoisomerase-6 subunit B
MSKLANQEVPVVEQESNGSNGTASVPRRATAQSMAAQQREISVSEFFTKNKHLLGFDNPRKALLTTVKEAVDNSLDACEEAGILPEIWIKITEVRPNRYRVSVQDNGPGIVKKQIPLIFGKLLYGSKFHRLRMSRGQQGIGISAAGMNGWITTGVPVKIISKTGPNKPAHYFEIQINTQLNRPEIRNGDGEGVDIPPGQRGLEYMATHGIEWVSHYDPAEPGQPPQEIASGTRVTIELAAKYQRGRGSVDEYIQLTAIANPHVTIHYEDPEGQRRTYARATTKMPPEPQEIKPHPYGVELGTLVTMLQRSKQSTLGKFLVESFSRVSPGVARAICEKARLSIRTSPRAIHSQAAEALYHALQETKIKAPATDCVTPIGEELLLKGLRQVLPGEFYCAATRPPAVYRGNPFVVEVALAYGGNGTVERVTLELLRELLAQSDARTLRQFLLTTFDGLGPEGAERILRQANFGPRQAPAKLKPRDIERLYESMKNVNLSDGQVMQVLRFANRVPLQFKQRDCAITEAVINTNWRAYGLNQTRGSLPTGPVSVMVHVASVWVPFTSESKEAIASYPEIQRELRLALQAVGRKLAMYLNRRRRVHMEGQRRNIFQRYLGEVAQAVSVINGIDAQSLYEQLLKVARKKTADADLRFDEHGRAIQADEDFGENVIIVEPQANGLLDKLSES